MLVNKLIQTSKRLPVSCLLRPAEPRTIAVTKGDGTNLFDTTLHYHYN